MSSSKRKKNKAAAIVVGPILVIAAIVALWKNETRFDYHKAARATPHAATVALLEPGRNASYSGAMSRDLVLPGRYIRTFTGYLVVHRQAEIYCWERDEDEDGHVTWSKRWMGSLESNSRNRDLRQELHSGRMLPPSYRVGELELTSDRIEFVDARQPVAPGPLPKTPEGEKLRVEGDYLTLRKGRADELGDERLSFQAIPVPPRATWFGRYSGDRGVADTTAARSGMIASLIRDSGVLHHLVAGERDVALETMKQHIERLKWIVRGIGSALVVFGFLFFFSGILRFLYPVPILGRLAETGSFVLAFVIGLPLALTTILFGFVAGNPVLLVPILGVLLLATGIGIRFSKRRQQAGEQVRRELETEHGHALEPTEMKTLEYREMAGMLASGGTGIGDAESRALDRFARKSGFEADHRERLLADAKLAPPAGESAESHLRNLIRLCLADGKLTPREVRSIRDAASLAGYDREQFRRLMADVTRTAGIGAASST